MYYNITALTTHLYKECTNLQCILVVHSYVVGKSQLESELVLILEHSSLFFFFNIVKFLQPKGPIVYFLHWITISFKIWTEGFAFYWCFNVIFFEENASILALVS